MHILTRPSEIPFYTHSSPLFPTYSFRAALDWTAAVSASKAELHLKTAHLIMKAQTPPVLSHFKSIIFPTEIQFADITVENLIHRQAGVKGVQVSIDPMAELRFHIAIQQPKAIR